MFPKYDAVTIIPRGDYRIGDRQCVEAIQWPSYIDLTRNNVSVAGNWRQVHLVSVPNVKDDGYCQ